MTGPGRSRGNAWAWELLLVLVAYLAVFPTFMAGEVLAHLRTWDWGRVLQWLLPAVGGFLGAAIGRRLQGEERRRTERSVRQAVRTGVLPPEAASDPWRRMLRQQVTSAGAVACALVVLGVGGGGLTIAAAIRTSHDAAALWAVAAVQEVAAVVLVVVCLRTVRNGRRLAARLHAET